MTTVEIGSHIVTPRKYYIHHGIYAGEDLVIHYSGLSDGLSAGPIEITTLGLFLNGQDLRIRRYKNPRYTGQSVIERAYSRIGENKYDLQTNNCEHLCTWAVTGRSKSRQVETAEDIVDIVPGFTFFSSAVKARRHLKQEFDPVDVAKDVAEIGVKAAVMATVPIVVPVYAIYKAIKWVLK